MNSQRGASLIESLVAVVLAAVVALGATLAERHLRAGADVARQRTDAVRLAQREVETARGFAAAASAAPGADTIAALVDRDASAAGGSARYAIERRVEPIAGAKRVAIEVAWADRDGGAQQVRLTTAVSGHEAAYSAALVLGGGAPSRPLAAYGRAASIPVGAVSLGDGRSLWEPAGGGSGGEGIVFDDASGDAVARCASVAPAARPATAADVDGCTAGRWRLAAGVVRDGGDAVATPADGYPASAMCSRDAMKTVRYHDAGGGLRVASVAAGAQPSSLGLAAWSEEPGRHTAWRCLLPIEAPPRDARP